MSGIELLILTVSNALNYLSRYLLAAVKPAFSSGLGLSYEDTGWLLAAWALGYVFASPIVGLFADRFSRPKLLASSIVIWSLSLICFGLVRSFAVLFLLRLLLGISQAGFSTVVPGYLAERIGDPKRITRGISFLFCAIPVGTALAYGLGAMVADRFHWSWAFLLFGLPGFAFAAVIWRWSDSAGRAGGPVPNPGEGLRAVVAVPALRYAIGGYVLNSFGMNGIAGFIQDYGVQRGFELSEIGAYFLLILLLGSVGTVLGGSLCSRFERDSSRSLQPLFWFIGTTGLAATPFLLGAFLSADKFAFIAACGVGVWFVFVGTGPLNSILVRAAPTGLVNFVQGVTIVLLNLLGSFAAPPIVGRIADTISLQAGLLLCVGMLLASALVWIVGAVRCRHE